MLERTLEDIVPTWFQRIFPPPNLDDADEERTEFVRHFYLLFALIIVTCLALIPTFILFGRWVDALMVFAFLIFSVFILWYLPNLDLTRMAAFMAWGAYLCIVGGVFVVAPLGIYNPSLAMLYPVMIFTAFFSPQNLRRFAIASFLGYLVLYLSSFVFDYIVPHDQAIIDLLMAFLGITLAFSYLSFSIGRLVNHSRQMNEQQAQLLLQQNELVEYRDHLKELVVRRTADLEAAKDAAESANQTKTLFLSNMSQELRTPLDQIVAYSQLAQETLKRNALALPPDLRNEIQGDLIRLDDSGQKLRYMINRILDFSNLESGHVEVVRAAVLLQEILTAVDERIRPLLERKKLEYTVHNHFDADKQIVTDAHKLEQILFNLLDNSIKFTEEGRVSLMVRMVPTFDRGEEKQYLWFAIQDTGIGIPNGKLGDIFQPFDQAADSQQKQFGGTGLGLSFSQNLSKALGGYIDCSSTEGEGSTFNVYLPDFPLNDA